MSRASDSDNNSPRSWWKTIVIIVLVAAAIVALGKWGGKYVPQFAEWVHSLGPWGPIVFIGGYILAAIAGIPGSILTLAAGAIFGLWLGVAYVYVGAALGSIAAFLVSRYIARGFVEKKLADKPRFESIDKAIADDGRKIVFLLRLSPVFPFSLLNYALGLTKVRLIDFIIASVGMLPGTMLYVYYGKLAGDVAAVAGGASTPKDAKYWTFLGLGLLATIVVTALITRSARRALKSADARSTPEAECRAPGG